MRNQRLFYILICILFINISTQISIFGKTQWHEVKTKNFKLIGDADKNQLTKVGIKLEQFRETLRRLVPNLASDSPISTTVIVFKDNQTFHPYKPINAKGEITEWVAGYFQTGLDVNYITLSFGGNEYQAYQTVFHEYAHYLIDYNIGRMNIPPWYSEGLAEFYDQFFVRKDHIVKLGGRNSGHLEILGKNDLIPFDKFFTTDYENLRLQNQQNANLYYAQAWALMHYFMKGENGKRKDQLEHFLKLILQKQELKTAFKTAFEMTYSELEFKLSNHIKTGNLNATETIFDKKLTKDIETYHRLLSFAEVQANLGDLLYQRGRLAEAETHLQKALNLNPALSFANSTLGLVRMKQNNFEESNKYLKLAIESGKADYLEYFRYALFLSREVMTLDKYVSTYSGKRADKMRHILRKSIELNSRFPESYRLLAFINLVRNERIEEGIDYIKQALEISQGNQIYSLALAELYLRNKDFDNAESIATKVSKNAETQNIETKAKEILENLSHIRQQIAQALREKELNNINQKTINTSLNKKPRALTEDELEQNRKQTESEAISEVLRKPKEGEQRIVAKISTISCVNKKVIFTVESDNQITKLQSDDFTRLLMWTFTSEMRGASLGCSNEKKDIMAVLTYKPNEETTEQIVGNIISIEFVPRNFVLALK